MGMGMGYPGTVGIGGTLSMSTQGYAPFAQQPLDRQVYTEQISVPHTYTSMVPATTMQNRTVQVPVQTPYQYSVNSTIQVPVQTQVQVPRPYMEAQAYQYQVPVQTFEEQTIQVPRTVYETQTIRVPKIHYETKTGSVQVQRMGAEMQSVTGYQTQPVTTYQTGMQMSYANQTIQEPVQVMVPQTQTVNTIQNINKVIEYARTPVNQYTVAGPSYQTAMPYPSAGMAGYPMTVGTVGMMPGMMMGSMSIPIKIG